MDLLIGIPGYTSSGGNLMSAALAALIASHPGWGVNYREADSSFLTLNFNSLFAMALGMRDAGKITHFLMVHSDIRPLGADWFDTLYAEMEKADAQVISAISPIKNYLGLTSTAWDNDPWRPTRVTMNQAKELPVTWTSDKLLLNTGLMLCDMRGEWAEKICFTVNNRLFKRDGMWQVDAEPEDWNFSRQLMRLGVRYYVTRATQLDHMGHATFSTLQTWGNKTDDINKSDEIMEVRDVAGAVSTVQLGRSHSDVLDPGLVGVLDGQASGRNGDAGAAGAADGGAGSGNGQLVSP